MKHPNPRTAEKPARESAPDVLRIAHEIHTLAQMVYARLAPQTYGSVPIPGLLH
jgi:hypothetical protein